MHVYKLKVLSAPEFGESSLKDIYFNMEAISGFYIPEKHEDDAHIDGEFVTLCHHGEWTNVLMEPHLVNYLTEKFVDKAIYR